MPYLPQNNVFSFLTKGVVYAAINLINSKLYVGMTTASLKQRISCHLSCSKTDRNELAFHGALRKYGSTSFYWVVLFQSNDKTLLLAKEVEFIRLLGANLNGVGYNLTDGGEHPTFTDETKNKIRAKALARNISGANNPFFGKKHTAETRAHFSLLRRGKKPSNGFVKHSAETKNRLSALRREWVATPGAKRIMALCNPERRITTCVQTGQVFESIKQAALFLGVNYSTFKKYLREGNSIKGFSFTTAPCADS